MVRNDNTQSNFKMRKEDPFLMKVFQRRNFKLDDPIEQGTSCYEQDENGQGVNVTKSLLLFLEKQNHLTIIRRSDGIFRSKHCLRSTENDFSVQSIPNDDVLANNIRRQR